MKVWFGTVAIATALTFGAAANAQEGNVADSSGCGLGTKILKGKQGVGPQVLAITTNGTYYNQFFAISSGTSGCTKDGVIRSPNKIKVITTAQLDGLARDVAQGEGEVLDSLAEVMAIEPADQKLFRATMQGNFERIFPSENVTADEVTQSITAVMAEDASLSRYVPA